MEVKILFQTENPLLGRKEVLAELFHQGAATIPRREVLAQLSKHLKEKENLIIIEEIKTRTGFPACQARALIYSREEDIPSGLRQFQDRRMKIGKQPAGQAEAKPEEKPES